MEEAKTIEIEYIEHESHLHVYILTDCIFPQHVNIACC